MMIREITYSSDFIKELRALPKHIILTAGRKELLFKANPLHPSLRLHSLKGHLEGIWSISITQNYRIIFERQKNGDILFISVGTHDIYRNL